MTQLIKVKVDDTEFWIEPDSSIETNRKPMKASLSSDVLEKSIDFDLFSKKIGTICSSLKKSFDGIPKEMKPSKVSTEFGLKISLEGDIFLVKTSGEATITISAEWQFP